jgi:DNA-binding CsgD family transcriptional regulator/putative methionine-R-sulfoxide reductase with GAF domain
MKVLVKFQMKDKEKTRAQLIYELKELRRRLIQLEAAENKFQQAMEEINRSYQIQTILNKLLHISLENFGLEAMLEQFIDEITSISWLALESKGAIFLVGEEAEMLEMKAYRALSSKLLKMCARVPFGKCLCGRAAMLGETQFADCIDERHEYGYNGISAHGHYCVPIISGKNEVLGVITLYVKEEHPRDQREENFLSAVADTLAGIIELINTQQKLKERGKELEITGKDLEEVNTALRVLLKKRDEDKLELEENFLFNIKQLVKPYLEKLKNSSLDEKQHAYLNILESNIDDIISPMARKLGVRYLSLSASEMQVANLVMDGKRTKEIAMLLNLSDKTIEVHRKNIRKKLGLKNKKLNLRTHLLSLQNK